MKYLIWQYYNNIGLQLFVFYYNQQELSLFFPLYHTLHRVISIFD